MKNNMEFKKKIEASIFCFFAAHLAHIDFFLNSFECTT